MMRSVPLPAWKTYSCAGGTLVRSAAPFLSQRFVDESFRFRQALTGAKAQHPASPWKRRCARLADTLMGEGRSRSRS